MLRTRRIPAHALAGAGLVLAFLVHGAAAQAQGFQFSGYLNLRYAYVGSTTPATRYNGARLTGKLTVSTAGDRVRFVFRSHHYLQFAHVDASVLSSSYESRNIFHTLYLETRDLGFPGLTLRVGRQSPDVDYAAGYILDGVRAAFARGHLTFIAAAGKSVDVWNGGHMDADLQIAGGIRWTTPTFQWGASVLRNKLFGRERLEIAGGFSAMFGDRLWFQAQAAYDARSRELSRASAGISWRNERGFVSITASHWRNAFDQFVQEEQLKSATFFGQFAEPVPVDYNDLRIRASVRLKGLRIAGGAGLLTGVRSGWLAYGRVTFPRLWRWRIHLGGRAMQSDFTNFYALSAGISTEVGPARVRLVTEARIYQWVPSATGFKYADNSTYVEVEYPMLRHLYLRVTAGAYFRELGMESRVKPRLETSVLYRF